VKEFVMEVIHPLIVRVTHWLNAFAMICMIMSGWMIYDANPLFGFSFPKWMALGGWLGGAIAWHLAAMWLLVGNGAVYIAWGLLSGHFRRRFLPIRGGAVWHDLTDALRLRLAHQGSGYNSVQRLFYVGVLALGILAFASGLSLWKPVQFQALAALFGGYEVARRVHFAAMAGIVAFLVVHIALVTVVPRRLISMVTGRDPVRAQS
jgi:thiosulfate reductase cytochrome b subunit